jgi:hypothetical protein
MWEGESEAEASERGESEMKSDQSFHLDRWDDGEIFACRIDLRNLLVGTPHKY